ncbi:MAG: translocation/assembly module TamB [Aquificaceae bacterium]|nr:translocation/assembly module TamB [Aquificaceae bacterium]MDW8096879.1 translocation/assembly module TamB domain-containing protein [Aquificaceae bacterium]
MRLVGYLFLLLLSLYFLLLKPYLLAKRVQLQVRGLGLSLEKGLWVQSLLLHAPLRQMTLHLYVKELSLKPWQFRAAEVSLIHVSSKPPSDRPFDYDFTPLIRLASRINLRVEKLYVSNNYLPGAQSLTLFVPRTELRAGKLLSSDWTQAYWLQGQRAFLLEVLPERVQVVGDQLVVEKARLRSSLYQVEVKFRWKGKEGSFQAQGEVFPVEGRHFRVGRTQLTAEGTVGYTKVRVSFEGRSELELKGRRHYRDLGLTGEYLWDWRRKNLLRAHVWEGDTSVNLLYSLQEGTLEASFSDLLVDGELLSAKRKVFALASGQIKVDLKRHLLNLQVYAPNLRVQEQEVRGVNLQMQVDYREKPKGSFSFSCSEPFYLLYSGSFSEGGLFGNATLIGYNFRQDNATFELSYNGQASLREGLLFLKGGGRLGDITYGDLTLGSGGYSLELTGDTYQLEVFADTFSLQGGGSTKDGSFSGRLLLNSANLLHQEVDLSSLSGQLNLKLKREELSARGELSGEVRRGELSSKVRLELDLKRGRDAWQGEVEGRLAQVRLGALNYREGQFTSRLEGNRVQVSFDLGQELRGEGYYQLKEKSYRFEGLFRRRLGELYLSSSYQIQGRDAIARALLRGTGTYRDLSFPVEARLEMDGDRLEGLVAGFTLKNGLLTIRVGGLRFYGSKREGLLEAEAVSALLGQEKLLLAEFERGSYKAGKFSLKGRLSGAVQGQVELAYDGGPRVSSQGFLDLQKTLSLVRSRLLMEGEGQVFYRLTLGEKVEFQARSERVLLRSRHLALPLWGSLQVSLTEKGLSGRVSLRGNQKAYLLANLSGNQKEGRVDFQVANLPVLHRSEDLRTSLLLSGRGVLTSNYNNLALSGRFSLSGLVNLQRWAKRKGAPPESYKRVSLDLVLDSSEPLRVNLPEGFLYADLSGQVKGNLYEPDYRIKAHLKGGKLNYFDRDFFVRGGEIELGKGESRMELTISTPTPNYNVIIHLQGNPQYPKAVVRSEPPRDQREVLTALLLGAGEGDSLIPVPGALLSQLPQLGGLIKGAKSATGLDVKLQVYPSLSPTGEVGLNAVISKDITERLSVEHKQSTLKDPRETYTGGELRLLPGTSVGGRVYSDRTQEFRVRVRRKFDF